MVNKAQRKPQADRPRMHETDVPRHLKERAFFWWPFPLDYHCQSHLPNNRLKERTLDFNPPFTQTHSMDYRRPVEKTHWADLEGSRSKEVCFDESGTNNL